jgi:hypothetical protein
MTGPRPSCARRRLGPGAVMLVEIPTGDEFMDNIVAFWRPEAPLAPGSEHRFAYSITWTRDARPGARRAMVQSRSGREHDRPGTRRYVIDVTGEPDGLMPEITGPEAVEIDGVSSVCALPGGGTRLTFLLRRETRTPPTSVLSCAMMTAPKRRQSGCTVGPARGTGGSRLVRSTLDLGPKRPVVGGHANARPIEHLCLQHARTARAEKPVQRQEGAADGETWPGRDR